MARLERAIAVTQQRQSFAHKRPYFAAFGCNCVVHFVISRRVFSLDANQQWLRCLDSKYVIMAQKTGAWTIDSGRSGALYWPIKSAGVLGADDRHNGPIAKNQLQFFLSLSLSREFV